MYLMYVCVCIFVTVLTIALQFVSTTSFWLAGRPAARPPGCLGPAAVVALSPKYRQMKPLRLSVRLRVVSYVCSVSVL